MTDITTPRLLPADVSVAIMTDAEYFDLWIICRQVSRMVGNAAEWECIKYCLDSLTIHVNANTVADMKDRQFFLLNVQGFLEVDSDLATLKLESTLYMTATHLSNGPTMTSTLKAVGGCIAQLCIGRGPGVPFSKWWTSAYPVRFLRSSPHSRSTILQSTLGSS